MPSLYSVARAVRKSLVEKPELESKGDIAIEGPGEEIGKKPQTRQELSPKSLLQTPGEHFDRSIHRPESITKDDMIQI